MENTTTSNTTMIATNKGIVICGTDTDVGKTIVSALIVQGLNGVYWKPIQSGLEDGSDTCRVSTLVNLSKKQFIPELYKFQASVSPHWAAEKENQKIDPRLVKLPVVKGPLVVETAGGLLVPINRDFLQIELLKEWKLPIVLVARSGLGTINHTLLSIEALKKRSIPILGIILNGPLHKDNPKTIEHISGVSIIAQLPHLTNLSANELKSQWDKQGLKKVFKEFIK
ncbi:dethiobiotin synthase [Prochlorococcus sp. MIT 1223]|uniref:dethiobiotin synthase n=1 Tax=Prochlorococcus sp. MIT 1223 TaxID=3096217 RepID=UPI002A75AED6|nr:dethiobiotin synthase [Prochlorococcus sp. MIT 1223]